MPTKFLVVETPSFQLGANAGANAERVDLAGFAARLQQHAEEAKAGSHDMLFVLAPSELRMQSAYGDAISGQIPVSLALFDSAQDAIRFLPSLLAFDGAERSGGAKEFLEKGSTVYSETFFNAKAVGSKLDPCFTFARTRLEAAASANAWACLQAMVFTGLQYLPEYGEKNTGEKVDVQIGADAKMLVVSVRFDLAPEKLAFLRVNPVLSLPRSVAGAFESRYVGAGRKAELNCVFFRDNPGGKTVEIASCQPAEAAESADVKEYDFRAFGSIGTKDTPAVANAAPKGGFKKKFSARVKAASPLGEEAIKVAGGPNEPSQVSVVSNVAEAPYKEATVIVSGAAGLAPDKETIFKNENAANRVIELEALVKSLEAQLKTRDELLQKATKDSADPLKKRDVISGIVDTQNEGLKGTIKNLETELNEAKEREKELMKMVDKAVQMKDEAAKKIKELDLKLKQASGAGGSKVQMLEKALEEQKRQNKELSRKINDLTSQLKAA